MSRLNRTTKSAVGFAGSAMTLLLLVTALLALTGCVTDAQVVRISKGEASLLGKLAGANGRYCQITATKGVSITEQDRQAAREYCAPDEARIIELIRRGQEL